VWYIPPRVGRRECTDLLTNRNWILLLSLTRRPTCVARISFLVSRVPVRPPPPTRRTYYYYYIIYYRLKSPADKEEKPKLPAPNRSGATMIRFNLPVALSSSPLAGVSTTIGAGESRTCVCIYIYTTLIGVYVFIYISSRARVHLTVWWRRALCVVVKSRKTLFGKSWRKVRAKKTSVPLSLSVARRTNGRGLIRGPAKMVRGGASFV